MKFIFLIFFSVIGSAFFAPCCQADQQYEHLMFKTKRYMDFINKFGSSQNDFYEDDIKSFFAANFKMTINGRVFFETQGSYLEKMIQTKQWTGGWIIKPIDIVISTQSQTSVMSYLCCTSEDDYATVVFLHYDADGVITEVNVIYNKFENPAHQSWYFFETHH